MGAVYGYIGKMINFSLAAYCQSSLCGKIFCRHHPNLSAEQVALRQSVETVSMRGAKSGNGIGARAGKMTGQNTYKCLL